MTAATERRKVVNPGIVTKVAYPESQTEPREQSRAAEQDDIDEQLEETFPASDPPSRGGTT